MARFMDFHEDLKLPPEARQHHAALGVPCGEVHQVDWLTWPGRIEESRHFRALRADERDRQLLEAQRARMDGRHRPEPAAPPLPIAPVRRLARLIFRRATA